MRIIVAVIVTAVGIAATPVIGTPVSGDDPRVYDVETADFAFRAADTVEAGYVTIRMANKGPDLHHVALLKLEQGKTLGDLLAASARGPVPRDWYRDVGGPNVVVPGDTSRAAVSLEPGRYALVCLVHGPDRVMHVAKGMAKEIVVVPARTASRAARAARPAVPDAEMTLDDFSFTLSKPLAAGRRVLRVKNAAPQAHEVVIVQLAPGRTVQDVVAFFLQGEGAPPGRPVGGTTGIAQGGFNDVMLDLKPGAYGLICFYPDAKDGKPHLAHGMVATITVE
ncbi:MAG: hypothetical protein ACJ8AO_19100 [Gemmatimonadaceae bacterium]